MTATGRNKGRSGEAALKRRTLRDQREANYHLVLEALRLGQQSDVAEEARERAERHAQEMRELADLRETFLGIVSHDLRNPLGSIILGAGILLRPNNLDEANSRVVMRMVKSAERMSRMLTQVLEFAQVRLGGGLPMQAGPADLRVICNSVVDELALGAAIGLTPSDDDMAGRWDADRLVEALSNLVGNAVEHATLGTPVEVKVRAEGSDVVVVEVRNQGEPVSPEMLPFIFEPFRRGREPRTGSGNLGLGLYIANQIALAHGGTLAVSFAGGTTTFTMSLPRHAAT